VDTLQVIALIVIALIVLAVVIAFRKKITLTLQAWGLNLNLEAENEPAQPQAIEQGSVKPDIGVEASAGELPAPATGPAGVRVRDAESSHGGLLIEEGLSATGPGVDVEQVKVKDDIVIGKGQSGPDPKEPPPA
jgi:hypothetical protein